MPSGESGRGRQATGLSRRAPQRVGSTRCVAGQAAISGVTADKPVVGDVRRLREDLVAVDVLRQAALHRETASLLELRARQATTPQKRDQLLRRAQHRRSMADRLRKHFERDAAERRHPSAQP
jgi:hypothetical protein